jgi:hypothetical protein
MLAQRRLTYEAVDDQSLEVRYAGFVAALSARTGRNLDGWLQLIRNAGFGDKNDVLDFLIAHGFRFLEASWLERTSASGGRSPFESERRPTPLPLEGPGCFPVYRSPEAHAKRFLEWWWETGRPTGERLSREVQGAYPEMCQALGWEARGWNRVGASLRVLVADRKQYRDVIVDGRRHRWCTIRIPQNPAGAGSEPTRYRLAVRSEPTPSRRSGGAGNGVAGARGVRCACSESCSPEGQRIEKVRAAMG